MNRVRNAFHLSTVGRIGTNVIAGNEDKGILLRTGRSLISARHTIPHLDFPAWRGDRHEIAGQDTVCEKCCAVDGACRSCLLPTASSAEKRYGTRRGRPGNLRLVEYEMAVAVDEQPFSVEAERMRIGIMRRRFAEHVPTIFIHYPVGRGLFRAEKDVKVFGLGLRHDENDTIDTEWTHFCG